MFFGSSHKRKLIVIASMSFYLGVSCTTEEKFPDISTNFAGPVDVAAIGELSFVLNSDFDRNYNTGSIVTVNPALDSGSEKLSHHIVPRMGRSIFSRGDFLIATYDRVELEGMGSVELYQAASDGTLTTLVSQEIDCSPISATISPSQNWAIVSCIGGEIFVSPLDTSNVAAADFRLVRNYGYAHRALFVYEQGSADYLLAFPTDMGEQSAGDLNDNDLITYLNSQGGESGTELQFEQEPNEVPDLLESSPSAIFQFSSRLPYQMAVLNLTVNQENDFYFKEIGSISKQDNVVEVTVGGAAKSVYEYANHELKFVYFNLGTNPGTTPDTGNANVGNSEEAAGATKYYRTNFWEAQEISSSSFYLGHRGIDQNGSTDANNVIEFQINDNDGSTFAGPSSNPPTPFSKTFTQMFTEPKRIYGYSNAAQTGYVGDFEVAAVGSSEFVFINQFRDEAYWDSTYRLYAVDAKNLNSTTPNIEPVRWIGSDFNQSAYQLALTTASGAPSQLVSCSFYGDSVLVFDINESTGIDASVSPKVIF